MLFWGSFLLLTYLHDMLTKCSGNDCFFYSVFQSLRSCFCASWSGNMTRITVVAWRFKVWAWMVSPYVRGFHASISVLAVCDCVPWQFSHEIHLSQPPPWVLYEIILWREFLYKRNNVRIYFVTELCVIGYWRKVSVWFFSAMLADCRNRICGAVWRCPYNIRLPKQFQDVFCRYFCYVLIEVYVFKTFVPFYGKHFMPCCFKRFAYRPCPCK